MTDEEIARKAWAETNPLHTAPGLHYTPWDDLLLSTQAAITRAAALGREEGRREAAEPKPEPVDEDLLAAREWRAQRAEERGQPELAATFRAGKFDTNERLQAYLSGLKAARAKLAPTGPDAAVLKARELCAALLRECGFSAWAAPYESGEYDNEPELLAVAAAIREGV